MWHPSRKQGLGIFFGLVLALTATILLGFRFSRRAGAGDGNGFRTGAFEPPRQAPDFSLQSSKGARVTMGEQRGKITILDFGYTHCQTVCPITLGTLSRAFKELGPAAKDVELVYVTVDPKRDSPERLAEYLATFDPRFIGATGTEEELARVREGYGIMAEEVVSKNEALKYEMSHSSFYYLIDKRGMVRTLVPFGRPSADIVHDINLLLKE